MNSLDDTQDGTISMTKVTRFEVIEGGIGRTVVRHNVSVQLSLQDEGRTLKVFLEKKQPTEGN